MSTILGIIALLFLSCGGVVAIVFGLVAWLAPKVWKHWRSIAWIVSDAIQAFLFR